MVLIQAANLAVRFLLELCALTALGYWGFHSGNTKLVKMGLGIGTPLLAAIIWGTFVAPNATISVSAPIHLLLEFLVLGAAVFALYDAGRHWLSALLAVVMIINRALMYIWHQ